MDKNTSQSKPRLCGSAKNYWCPFFIWAPSLHFLRVFSKKRLSGSALLCSLYGAEPKTPTPITYEPSATIAPNLDPSVCRNFCRTDYAVRAAVTSNSRYSIEHRAPHPCFRVDAQDVLYRASLPDQRFRGENAGRGGSSHAVAGIGGLPGLVQALNGCAMREVIPRRDLRRQSVHRAAI